MKNAKINFELNRYLNKSYKMKIYVWLEPAQTGKIRESFTKETVAMRNLKEVKEFTT